MIKFFRKLKWLIKHQAELEKLLTKKETPINDGTYSLVGVPEYQKEYIKELLSEKQ